MKKILFAAVLFTFMACDSVQKGDPEYDDSTDAKMDTTTINYTPERSDSIRSDSTAVLNTDSSYVK